MKTSVTEDSPYPIPLDTLVPVRLNKVEYVKLDYIVKKGPNAGNPGIFTKWEWDFSITDGEYAGLSIRGNSEPKITSSDDRVGDLHLARPWVEALLNRALDLGEEIDTDDLIGLTAMATVEHQPPRPKKEGEGNWYSVALDELFPAGSMGSAAKPAGGDPWSAVSGNVVPPF